MTEKIDDYEISGFDEREEPFPLNRLDTNDDAQLAK